MRLNRFDLNLLLVLDVLLEERNVTRASQRLHISQSGASAALNRLREYFGDDLLVPVARQLMLTPLAQSLVAPVREALLQVRAAIARQPGFDPATAQRRFVVCASDYVTTVLLAHAVQKIALQAPHLSLDIQSPPKDVFQTFDRGTIDLLVMPQQYVEGLPHPQTPLFGDGHVCLVWSGHATIADSLTLEQYMDQGHVAVRFGDERSVSFEEWFLPRYGPQRRVECSVDNFSTLPLLVLGTQRVVTLHRRLARHFARALPLRMLELPFEMPALIETMAWPRHLENDPAHQWFRQQVRACAQELDGG
jgi:LysR family transcriptional regulator, nod-box dependent transcriptional activator